MEISRVKKSRIISKENLARDSLAMAGLTWVAAKRGDEHESRGFVESAVNRMAANRLFLFLSINERNEKRKRRRIILFYKTARRSKKLNVSHARLHVTLVFARFLRAFRFENGERFLQVCELYAEYSIGYRHWRVSSRNLNASPSDTSEGFYLNIKTIMDRIIQFLGSRYT